MGKPGHAEGLPVAEQRTGPFNLTKREQAWLTGRPSAGIHWINRCYKAVTTLYILCMNTFDEECQKQGETVETFIDNAMRKAKALHYRVEESMGGRRYNVYYLLFRKAENAVRRKYHVSKVHDTFFFDSLNVTLEHLLGNPFTKILEAKSDTIPPLNDGLDRRLNEIFAKRWLDLYLDIEESVNKDNWKEKAVLIHALPIPAGNAGHADKVFISASKFFMNYDPAAAVSFYLRHLHADAERVKGSALHRFKKTYGAFFTTKKQLDTFEGIANKLLLSGDINAALTEAPFIFNKKYAAVELDEAAIDHVAVRHAATVQVLNKLLAEEEEATPVSKKKKNTVAGFLSPVQLGLLQLFHNNRFTLSNQAVNTYAKSTGFLKSQLIESINEDCSTILGDVLIEETAAGYEVLEKYYHKIITA